MYILIFRRNGFVYSHLYETKEELKKNWGKNITTRWRIPYIEIYKISPEDFKSYKIKNVKKVIYD